MQPPLRNPSTNIACASLEALTHSGIPQHLPRIECRVPAIPSGRRLGPAPRVLQTGRQRKGATQRAVSASRSIWPITPRQGVSGLMSSHRSATATACAELLAQNDSIQRQKPPWNKSLPTRICAAVIHGNTSSAVNWTRRNISTARSRAGENISTVAHHQ